MPFAWIHAKKSADANESLASFYDRLSSRREWNGQGIEEWQSHQSASVAEELSSIEVGDVSHLSLITREGRKLVNRLYLLSGRVACVQRVAWKAKTCP